MARQPEVFVRPLEPAEAQRLVKITRTARDRVGLRLRRAGIVLASVQGRSAAEAAAMFAASPSRRRNSSDLPPIMSWHVQLSIAVLPASMSVMIP